MIIEREQEKRKIYNCLKELKLKYFIALVRAMKWQGNNPDAVLERDLFRSFFPETSNSNFYRYTNELLEAKILEYKEVIGGKKKHFVVSKQAIEMIKEILQEIGT